MELGPVATGYQIAIWLIVALCFLNGSRENRFIASAMALSSVFAIAATWFSVQSIMIVPFTLGACLAILVGTKRALAIAVLYSIRLVLFGFGAVGVLSGQMTWELSLVFLTFQMVIALWSGIDGLNIKSKSQIFFRNLSKKTNFSRETHR